MPGPQDDKAIGEILVAATKELEAKLEPFGLSPCLIAYQPNTDPGLSHIYAISRNRLEASLHAGAWVVQVLDAERARDRGEAS